jgi:hypothetical protein
MKLLLRRTLVHGWRCSAKCPAQYCSAKFKMMKRATQRKFNSSNTAWLKKLLTALFLTKAAYMIVAANKVYYLL